MEKAFPRTMVGGISMPRMIIGSNWLLGYSHTGPAADQMIQNTHSAPESIARILAAFMAHGVDAFMAALSTIPPALLDAFQMAEDLSGRKLILIDTPLINVDDTPAARKEAETIIRHGKKLGAAFCLPHHANIEQLVNKNKGTLERIGDYTAMIRDAGLIPGLSAHMPELVVYSDQNGYDVETYIQIYNPMGFLMQVEVETVAHIIHHAQKPVITIKPMAAGRCSPYVGLSFVWNTIRPCDMVTVGVTDVLEVEEDIEISLAALEGRYPRLGRRASPNNNQAAFGG